MARLRGEGYSPVVVHGGGKMISDWMKAQGVRPAFRNGLRVTDAQSLDIVVAVLAGLINKRLTTRLWTAGAKAAGLSGADGGMLTGRVKDPALGFVGEVESVDADPILALTRAGYIPVIAPIAACAPDDALHPGALLNVNADTAAGEIARALGAERLFFLTDVEGVLDRGRRLIRRLTARQARSLAASGTISGGMIPKIEACLRALDGGCESRIIDGRSGGALPRSLADDDIGTRIG